MNNSLRSKIIQYQQSTYQSFPLVNKTTDPNHVYFINSYQVDNEKLKEIETKILTIDDENKKNNEEINSILGNEEREKSLIIISDQHKYSHSKINHMNGHLHHDNVNKKENISDSKDEFILDLDSSNTWKENNIDSTTLKENNIVSTLLKENNVENETAASEIIINDTFICNEKFDNPLMLQDKNGMNNQKQLDLINNILDISYMILEIKQHIEKLSKLSSLTDNYFEENKILEKTTFNDKKLDLFTNPPPCGIINTSLINGKISECIYYLKVLKNRIDGFPLQILSNYCHYLTYKQIHYGNTNMGFILNIFINLGLIENERLKSICFRTLRSDIRKYLLYHLRHTNYLSEEEKQNLTFLKLLEYKCRY